MTRKLLLSLLLLCLLLALPASAAPSAVPLPRNDSAAVSATNGESTLVAWTNMYSVYANNWSVYIRLLDSPFDRNANYLGPGYAPRVATNGRQYLVGYSIFGSRFNSTIPYDNTAVQLVSPEGVLIGPRRIINQSIFGGLLGVAWNGTHWLAAYRAGAPSITHVAFLDQSLNIVSTLEVGMGTLLALDEIDGRWWAIRGDALSVVAVELRPDGTAGARFPGAPLGSTAYDAQLTHGHSPLLLLRGNDRIDAMPFDPFTGFGERRTLLEATRLIDVEEYEGGSLLLVASSDNRYDTIFIDANGEIGPRLPLLEVPTLWPYNSLGASKTGLLLFITPRMDFSLDEGDLYAYRIPPSRAPIDAALARLVSQVSVPVRRRGARH